MEKFGLGVVNFLMLMRLTRVKKMLAKIETISNFSVRIFIYDFFSFSGAQRCNVPAILSGVFCHFSSSFLCLLLELYWKSLIRLLWIH